MFLSISFCSNFIFLFYVFFCSFIFSFLHQIVPRVQFSIDDDKARLIPVLYVKENHRLINYPEQSFYFYLKKVCSYLFYPFFFVYCSFSFTLFYSFRVMRNLIFSIIWIVFCIQTPNMSLRNIHIIRIILKLFLSIIQRMISQLTFQKKALLNWRPSQKAMFLVWAHPVIVKSWLL